jgi:lipoate-protein ligase A
MLKNRRWRFIDTGVGSAEWNMAVDEVLLKNHKESDFPTLRFYGWNKALSAGRFSKIEQSVDLEKLEKNKIACVRRLSGGGILVHDNDLSYSLIFAHNFLKDKSVKENYFYLCSFLINLYKKFGLNAEFACKIGLQSGHSNICLAGREPYDIMIDGKKMGGNAQRYTRSTMFQHGSIPISLNETLFESLFLQESGLKDAATLQKLGVFAAYKMLSKTAVETFCETYEAEIEIDTLSASEKQSVKELMQNKYTQKRWNIYAKSS